MEFEENEVEEFDVIAAVARNSTEYSFAVLVFEEEEGFYKFVFVRKLFAYEYICSNLDRLSIF